MTKRTSVQDIKHRKGKEKIVVLTAYTAPYAEILDPHVDMLLVGDTVGMVLYGMESTLAVSLDIMIAHGQAVMRGSTRACVVIDLPFGTYQESKEHAFRSACDVIKRTHAQAVKLEGGEEMAPTVAFLTARGIPVVAHIGLMPQHVHTMGGFKVQGKDTAEQERLLQAAVALQEAGAFAIVLEGVKPVVADTITQTLTIPTIGIGASPLCDGQVLVTEDMLGLFEKTAKFVKPYASLRTYLDNAAQQYSREVRSGEFPDARYCY